MIKLIISDMDGTLLGHDSGIPKENAQAILWAKNQGMHFAIATGRHINEAKNLLHDAGIICPILAVNGAAIYNEQGQLMQSFHLDKGIAKQIVEICQQYPDVLVELTTIDQIVSDNPNLREILIEEYVKEYLDSQHPEFKKMVREHIQNLQAIIVNSLVDYIDTAPTHYILKVLISSINNVEALHAIKKRLSSFTNVTVTSSHELNIEVTSLQATKGNAVLDLAKQLHIPLSDVMAMGDNMNDQSMLSIVGYPVAMGNAVDQIKSLASYITDTHGNNGVAKAIYHYLKED